ncbi:ubiquitin-conjugating enzyme E2 D2B-like [Frankliniella occidentalis]|uniref:Ubiquitin-conjugating enzyme E2 D2B-like n=1 Tax=Frankliniella occidentalis TaxID=133901 RepID=A0A9C6WZR8_FRAOC|nr:ubiquitin-conjugating enzyme E2 D2B-like [Frankliniella occidentalis]
MANIADRRLRIEMAQMATSPLPYARAKPREENIRIWDASVMGPVGSPYEGGKFNFTMTFYSDYPSRAPKVTFKTKIYHCNINPIGNVCLNILKMQADGGSWSSGMGVNSILLSMHQLLGEPNPDDPLVRSISQMYKKKRDEHDRIARRWTEEFAMGKATQK